MNNKHEDQFQYVSVVKEATILYQYARVCFRYFSKYCAVLGVLYLFQPGDPLHTCRHPGRYGDILCQDVFWKPGLLEYAVYLGTCYSALSCGCILVENSVFIIEFAKTIGHVFVILVFRHIFSLQIINGLTYYYSCNIFLLCWVKPFKYI